MANIFLVSDSRGSNVAMFVESFYGLLMTRRPVSYADIVYHTDPGVPADYFDSHTISSYDLYSPLKKAVSLVRKELDSRFPGSVADNGKAKGKTFRYVGEADDPLAEDRKHYRQQTVEDYARFCKGAVGFLPEGWFSAFFEDTGLLLEAKRDAESGNIVVGGARDAGLRNVSLLPVLYSAITDHAAVRFEYKPYDSEAFGVALHPQYLKEYNGRWFLLGQTADENLEVKSYPVDRIVSGITRDPGIEYVQAPPGYYREYFRDIVGVLHAKDRKALDIVIRTHSAYHHGLVTTKPFHHSQKETVPYGTHEDGEYGEVTVHVEPTVDLIGRIMSLGAGLEVMSPPQARLMAAEAADKLSARYAPKG